MSGALPRLMALFVVTVLGGLTVPTTTSSGNPGQRGRDGQRGRRSAVSPLPSCGASRLVRVAICVKD
jgi:hypothetical protein